MSGILDPRLVAVLACPCPRHAGISPTAEGDALVCDLCATSFPVRDGIPVMLLDEAVAGPRGIGQG